MMIYAEKRREDCEAGYYTLRYLVYNGDTIGSYGVLFAPYDRAYGASRDYHQLAPPDAMERYKRYRDWIDGPDDAPYPEDSLSIEPLPCEYHDNKLATCDGSSLVEVTTDDERAFAIAAMMAGVTRDKE